MAARLFILIAMLTVSACSGRYLGIDRTHLDPSARTWYDRAQAGDKQAQYELGLRFARGDGVPRDCERARKLFRQAATNSGGTLWVYSPPVTKGGQGRVIPVDRGPVQPGLPAAQQALEIERLC